MRAINTGADGQPWLTDRRLGDLHAQLLRQPNRTLLKANEAIQAHLFKTQVNRNEVSGEADPVVKLIDFARPERNRFHAIAASPWRWLRSPAMHCVISWVEQRCTA